MSEANDDAGTPEGAGPASGDRQELPAWNRGRSKRKANEKAEAEGDAFTRGVMEAGRAAKQRSRLIVAAIVVAIAGVGAFVWWQQGSNESRVEDTRKLSAALAWGSRARVGTEEEMAADTTPPNPIFKEQAERDQAFADALAAAKGADSKEVAALAELVAAAQAFRAGDYPAAISGYDAFIASHAADHPMAFLAREGKALTLEAQGDIAGSLAAFEAMTAEGAGERFYGDMALWHQGRLLERLERPADAVAVYKRYLETYPEGTRSSLALEDVKGRLRVLDVPEAVPVDTPAIPEGVVPAPAPTPAEPAPAPAEAPAQ